MNEQNATGLNGVINSLRSLFSGYGFSEYKMNKFEEYDLYVKNKDFLTSKNIITFTDTSGKLLALKPDVTLSIVKNTAPSSDVKKVFYNESVYRASSLSYGYKEISQMGLECIGEIDELNVAEILTLAVESLMLISPNFVLDVSPIGLISAFVERLNLESQVKKSVYKCINEKNTHELKSILTSAGVENDKIQKLVLSLEVYGQTDLAVNRLKEIFSGTDFMQTVNDFANILSVLPDGVKEYINIDCACIESVKYYNSITFKGYVNGIPKEVLSGGRYDGLLKSMGKDYKAIGFAIYLDEVDRLFTVKKDYDVDVVIVYGDGSNKKEVLNKVKELFDGGKTVTAVKSLPDKLTFKQKIEM